VRDYVASTMTFS